MYHETVGYIIHQRDFRNSSIIIEFFSQDFGLLHILAKGIKKNKQLKTQLHYFSLLKIQFFGKSNLKTLTSINLLKQTNYKNIIHKTAGLYFNELLHFSLLEQDKAESLFLNYQKNLLNIGHDKLSPVLRSFEKEILKYNGFELSHDSSIEDDCWLGFDQHMTLSKVNIQSKRLCMNSDLKQFLMGKINNIDTHKRINNLMQHAINLSINHKRLVSREMLKALTSDKIG
ncbi:MAG: DNA repair protein RecO [Marinicellaceae bacterium]